MTAAAWRLVAALAVGTLTVGCLGRQRPPEPIGPTPWREWLVVDDSSERLVRLGQHAAADSLLADFMRRWPGSPEAQEGAWRLLVRGAARADDSTSATTLITRVDSALATSPPSAQRAQLLTMKRMAQLTQQLRAERTLLRAERDSTRARLDELEKLRAELAQVQAELERVRKRVTRRRPGG